jgi:hypothetical protein
MRTALLLALALVGAKATVNGPTWQGHHVQADLPDSQHLRNTVGINGMGLCVWTSLDHAARYQDAKKLINIRDRMRSQLGGGWPSRVTKIIERDCPDVSIAQYQGRDPTFLDVAMRTKRMACVTYGYSERYHGTISHMVNLVYLDKEWGCILDNNFPRTYEWMPRSECLKRIGHPRGSYWSVVILDPGPAPPPLLSAESQQ